MRPTIDYKETHTLVFTKTDAYGAQTVDEEVEVRGLAVLGGFTSARTVGFGMNHNANQDALSGDMTLFIDPADENAIDNSYRLEEALVVLDLFDTPTADSWYKVTNVAISRDHLLGNQIDNIGLSLKKTASISHVS